MERKRRIGHPGTSIVEILVAMVILVIGIYSIFRIFPTGFGMILYGEKVTRAEKLAQGALEQARAHAENVPDAIVPVDELTGNLNGQLTPQLEADDFNREPVTADQLSDNRPRVPLSLMGFNRTRRVFGETTKIPSPSADVPYMPRDDETGRPQLVSVYTLMYGPISLHTVRPVVYSGRTLERVVFTEDPTQEQTDALGFGRYGVNYERGLLLFDPTPYPRRYKLQYSFILRGASGPNRVNSRPDQFVVLPADTDRVAVPLPNGAQLEPGEEQVFRAFNEIPVGMTFNDTDPYQYKVLNDYIGILGFNPLAAVVRRSSGSPGITAKIDYDVADWHIVREDLPVPPEAPHRVRLTLNYVKHAGDIQDNQEPYVGLTPNVPNIDLLVVDLDTGLTMDSRSLTSLTGDAGLNGSIDYQTGTIHFNPMVQWDLPQAGQHTPPQSIAGKNLRLFYRTEDDFGLQVQKAFTTYLRSDNPRTVTPGQYGHDQYGEISPALFGYLLFPASDHGQTVVVDYSFTDKNTERRMTVAGEMQPIRDPQEAAAPAIADSTLWFAHLNNAAKARPGTLEVHSVRGVSVRSRAAWREGNRWRRLENSTYLTRQRT